MPYQPPRAVLLLTASLAACPDSPALPDESSTGESPSTSSPATTDDTPTTSLPTTGDPATSSADTSTGDAPGTSSETGATTGPDGACATFLCGALLACCAASDECIDGECAAGCADDIRCGEDLELCCAAGEVCLNAACVPVGDACTDSGDCDPGDYCDGGACLPVQDPPACTTPDDSITLTTEWEFTEDQVIGLPLVVDITGDGNPEVVVNTTRVDGLLTYTVGEIVALDGATGEVLWKIAHDPNQMRFGAHGRSTIAAGDVSGDGVADIVYAGYINDMTKTCAVHAVDGDGNLLWTARNANNTTAQINVDNGAPALANLDDDPMAEIAIGALIIDHDGLVRWNQGNQGGLFGSPHNKNMPTSFLYKGGIPTFADLTGDGYPELVTGREAWAINKQTLALTQLWKATSGIAGDGYPAVADLDLDGDPEVVLVAWPELKVLDGATGQLWCGVDPTGVMCENDPTLRTGPLEIFSGGIGGPPVIADFDGDARPEIGVTNGQNFRILDLNRMGETIVKPQQDPMPAPGAVYTRWSRTVQDGSSGSTGASAFDTNGDGAAELFFNDECRLRIYDGAGGQVLFEMDNSTAAIHEYPVLADVDADGRSEVLFIANQSDENLDVKCMNTFPGWTTRQGVFLARPTADNWTATRMLWTQHSYHVTNADSSGNVPMSEADNWTSPGLNTFRANVSGPAVLANAADLTVSLAIGLAQCGDSLALQAHIVNQGSLGVPAGVPVTFYAGTDVDGTEIATVPTPAPLVPGGFMIVETVVPAPADTASYYVAVDPDDAVGECFEANNGALAFEAGCP